MSHSKLHHILAIAALAALGAGCALEAPSDERGSEKTDESTSDLARAQTPTNGVNTVDLSAETPGSTSTFQKPNAVHKIVKTEQVLGGGGETDDGPRPHPWEPTPESECELKSSDNSNGSGAGSSPTK